MITQSRTRDKRAEGRRSRVSSGPVTLLQECTATRSIAISGPRGDWPATSGGSGGASRGAGEIARTSGE